MRQTPWAVAILACIAFAFAATEWKANFSVDVSGRAFQTPRASRGLAVGDLDSDGRPEIAVLNMNGTPSLLKNTGSAGNFLNVRLQGTKSNRSAIGARVTVVAGARTMIDEVMSGGSYYSQNSFTLHFGLGAVKDADRLEVRWPSGEVQKWVKLPGPQSVRITEGRDWRGN